MPDRFKYGDLKGKNSIVKMAKGSAVRIEIGRSFHQLGTVQEKVRESDLVPLWDGTTRRRSLAERKLLEGA